eukprot:TRINITY_DN1436_c0_g1_i3.p1 TRINITY_DN1436_c0_g1~~TRINITY_DN1436_c0_g1_i3.p1  ORF type:complete len:241 (-),score=27.10 TRINITY_DN1436_c0_g1_i3:64-786(-)
MQRYPNQTQDKESQVTSHSTLISSFRCQNTSFHCLDCNQAFTYSTVHQHNSCISETEKYFGKFGKKGNSNTTKNGNKVGPSKSAEPSDVPVEKSVSGRQSEGNHSNKSTDKSTTEQSVETTETKKNKRKRTNDEGTRSSKKSKKDPGCVDTTPRKDSVDRDEKASKFNTTYDLNSCKWEKQIVHHLKKAENKKMRKDDLKKQVVDTFLEDVRSLLESTFDQKLQSCEKVEVRKRKVYLRR